MNYDTCTIDELRDELARVKIEASNLRASNRQLQIDRDALLALTSKMERSERLIAWVVNDRQIEFIQSGVVRDRIKQCLVKDQPHA